MIVIGIDPHKSTHTATAVDPVTNTNLGSLRVDATVAEYRRLVAWAKSWPQRQWAIENAEGLGHHLAQWLLTRDEVVLDVPTTATTATARVRYAQSSAKGPRAIVKRWAGHVNRPLNNLRALVDDVESLGSADGFRAILKNDAVAVPNAADKPTKALAVYVNAKPLVGVGVITATDAVHARYERPSNSFMPFRLVEGSAHTGGHILSDESWRPRRQGRRDGQKIRRGGCPGLGAAARSVLGVLAHLLDPS